MFLHEKRDSEENKVPFNIQQVSIKPAQMPNRRYTPAQEIENKWDRYPGNMDRAGQGLVIPHQTQTKDK
jgi:hypothetical protein